MGHLGSCRFQNHLGSYHSMGVSIRLQDCIENPLYPLNPLAFKLILRSVSPVYPPLSREKLSTVMTGYHESGSGQVHVGEVLAFKYTKAHSTLCLTQHNQPQQVTALRLFFPSLWHVYATHNLGQRLNVVEMVTLQLGGCGSPSFQRLVPHSILTHPKNSQVAHKGTI